MHRVVRGGCAWYGHDMPLEVIGAGFGRTGTLSTKAALEALGLAPCYHFVEILQPRPGHNEGHRRAWVEFMKGRADMDWRWLFDRYDATLDFPTCFFYRELMEAFPEAKVSAKIGRLSQEALPPQSCLWLDLGTTPTVGRHLPRLPVALTCPRQWRLTQLL